MFTYIPIKRLTFLIFGAIISIIFGYMSYKSLPKIMMKEIQKRVSLDPNSQFYELWKDAPVDILHKFYFFEITNPLEIEHEGAKPILKEIGPFTYNLYVKKVPVRFNDDDTVSYYEKKFWFFNRELSVQDENYVITTVNLPLVSALSIIKLSPPPIRRWITSTLDTLTEGIFIRRSIKQLTFYGYPDILVSIGKLIDPKTPTTEGRFAYLAQKNDTVDAEYTLFSGIDNQANLGLIDRVDGRKFINRWKDYPCRSLDETFTGQVIYSLLEKPRPNIQTYNDIFGRKLNLLYESTLESYPGIKAYRYSFDPNNFKNGYDYPPNACYTSRLPKEYFTETTSNHTTDTTNNQSIPAEKESSTGRILLDLALSRLDSNNPLANFFTRNLLSRRIANNSNNSLSRQSLAANETNKDYTKSKKGKQFPSGAFDFSELAFGAPVLLSQPHFLNADPYYNEKLIGLKPDAEKHDFFIDFEPITGAPIKNAIRLQVNVALLKSPSHLRFRNFKENVFPVFWQDIDMKLPEKDQSMLRMVTAAPNFVSEIVLCLFVLIGISLFTSTILIFAKSRTKFNPIDN